jgi:ABC-2 family transporter protein
VTTLTRVIMLTLRTAAPYRLQMLGLTLLILVGGLGKPEVIVPLLALMPASLAAVSPFFISDQERLDTLYAVLPLTRRSLLLGRYVWALAAFVALAGIGTPVSLLSARLENVSLAGNALAAIVAASWALFALNISIQFPLYVRFGYSRTGLIATAVPISAIVGATYSIGRAHVIKLGPIWPDLLAAGCTILFCASAALALTLNPHRARRPVAV